MKDELKALIKQAHEAGYLEACWQDGAMFVSNEQYEKSEIDLSAAVEEFLKKFGSLAQG